MSAFELGYRYVFPSVKRRLVEILIRELGLKQVEAARKMGLSQSAASKYLSMERGALIDVAKFKDVERKLRDLAEKVVSEDLDMYSVYGALLEVSLYLMGRGYLCGYHARIDPDVDVAKCRICTSVFSILPSIHL